MGHACCRPRAQGCRHLASGESKPSNAQHLRCPARVHSRNATRRPCVSVCVPAVLSQVEKAAGGLLSSGWPHLIDSPLQRLLSLAARPAVALREALLGRVYGRLEAISERMISEEVEEDYSGEDFLEGVKGAVGGWVGGWVLARGGGEMR